MLPTASDNGARLAAILPTGLGAMARGLRADADEMLASALPEGRPAAPEALPGVRSLILVVVDGLGSANLAAARQVAPTLASLPARRIDTVIPSTTGAALTTLATGSLPGAHGLIGYRIRHPRLGLRNTLKEWDGIDDVRSWQLRTPLWRLANDLGARAIAIGRPAHATGGLTEAILTGTEYQGGQTIPDRFAIASAMIRRGDPLLVYLYVDELDRAAHAEGWGSALWSRRLASLDDAMADLLRTLPGDAGVVVTADHGMLDVPARGRIMLDEILADRVPGAFTMIGGEPRFRSVYLADGIDPREVVRDAQAALGRLAWVGTRDAAIADGWFGAVEPQVAERLGEVLVVARSHVAFTLTDDAPAALAMVGQHGGLTAEERGVPVMLAGALAGSGFMSAVSAIATSV